MTERPTPFERGIRQEDLIISAQSLYDDNHSAQADAARERFNEKRLQGTLRGFIRCSDAREKTIGDSISIGNISAACEPSPAVASDRGLESLIALPHIDGDTIQQGTMPTGCGGLAAKATIGSELCGDGIERYISERIFSKDPVVQSLVTAERLAYLSNGKPVLAATLDHLRDLVLPIAYFQVVRGQLKSVSSVRHENIVKYNPERIYENGFPTIEESMLPPELAQILEDSRSEAEKTFELYPDLQKLKKIQRPRAIFLSTDIRSAKVKYPYLSSVPGSMFKIFIAREKLAEGISVNQSDLIHALDQLQYPIEHAVTNHDDPTLPFSNTDRLIVETGDIDLSRVLVQEALKKLWMQQWVNIHDHRIILVQTNAGKSNAIEDLSLSS